MSNNGTPTRLTVAAQWIPSRSLCERDELVKRVG
jgi:hypothetical protein